MLDFWVDQPEGVAQVVQTSLLLWLGEWSFDLTQGMPWIETVLGKFNEATADASVQDYVLGVEGVTGIENFLSASDQNTRRYTATFDLDTEYGETQAQIANQNDF